MQSTLITLEDDLGSNDKRSQHNCEKRTCAHESSISPAAAAASSMPAGISSVPISSRKSGTGGFHREIRGDARLLIDPASSDTHGQLADARDHTDALGDADCAARVEDVEQVRALQAKLVGGEQREAFNRFRSG